MTKNKKWILVLTVFAIVVFGTVVGCDMGGTRGKSSLTNLHPTEFNFKGSISLSQIETDILTSVLPGNHVDVDYSRLVVDVYQQNVLVTGEDTKVREGQYGDVSLGGNVNINFSGFPGNYYLKVLNPQNAAFVLYLYLDNLTSSPIFSNITSISTAVGIAVRIMKNKGIYIDASEVDDATISLIQPHVESRLQQPLGNVKGLERELQEDVNIIKITDITLDKLSLELKAGTSAPLVARVFPQGANASSLVWESSDNSIATVDQKGNVSAIYQGKAIITVKTSSGGFPVSCVVNVLPRDSEYISPVPVTGVQLSKYSEILGVTETSALYASVLPVGASNSSVTWSSSAEGIATVSSAGVVRGIREGVATITATTIEAGKQASCLVTVVSTSTKAKNKIELRSIVSNVVATDLTIVIKGLLNPATHVNSTTLTSGNGLKSFLFEHDYEQPYNQVILQHFALNFEVLDDFDTIVFDNPIPAGAIIEVYKDGGNRTLLTTGI